MSTTTTSDPWSGSLESSLNLGSSHSPRHKNSVPRSTSNPTSLTKTFSLLPSLKKSWEQSYSSFQTSARTQCPRMHYHPWCNDCQTLMEWEPLPPISPTCKKLIPTFGDLKMAVQEKSCCQSPFVNLSVIRGAIKKVCSTWREEQFTRAIMKRSAKMAAWEALRQSVHQQHVACGVAPPAT